MAHVYFTIGDQLSWGEALQQSLTCTTRGVTDLSSSRTPHHTQRTQQGLARCIQITAHYLARDDFFENNMHSSKRNNSLVIFRADFKSVVWFFISVSCFKIFQIFLKFGCYLALKYIFGNQNILILRENFIPKNFCSYPFFD